MQDIATRDFILAYTSLMEKWDMNRFHKYDLESDNVLKTAVPSARL